MRIGKPPKVLAWGAFRACAWRSPIILPPIVYHIRRPSCKLRRLLKKIISLLKEKEGSDDIIAVK